MMKEVGLAADILNSQLTQEAPSIFSPKTGSKDSMTENIL